VRCGRRVRRREGFGVSELADAGRVLVADDDADIRELVVFKLE
jgi:hypothetical protein